MNAIEALRTLLTDLAAITALVSTRVYGGTLPKPDEDTGVGERKSIRELIPCILLVRGGGSADDRGTDIRTARIDIRCMADSLESAQDVYEVILGFQGAEHLTAGSFHIFGLNEIVSGVDAREQLTESDFVHVVLSTWEMTFGTN